MILEKHKLLRLFLKEQKFCKNFQEKNNHFEVKINNCDFKLPIHANKGINKHLSNVMQFLTDKTVVWEKGTIFKAVVGNSQRDPGETRDYLCIPQKLLENSYGLSPTIFIFV